MLGGEGLYGLGLLADDLLGHDERLDHHVLGHLVGAGLDHRDGLLGPGDDEVQVALGELLVGGVEDEAAVRVAPDAHGPDRAVIRDVRERERRRGPDHADGVVRRLLVGDEHGPYDLYLVVVALGKEGPQGPVREPGGQDRPLGRPPSA